MLPETYADFYPTRVEATDGIPDENFTFTIGKEGEEAKPAAEYFGIEEPVLETWDFEWFE